MKKSAGLLSIQPKIGGWLEFNFTAFHHHFTWLEFHLPGWNFMSPPFLPMSRSFYLAGIPFRWLGTHFTTFHHHFIWLEFLFTGWRIISQHFATISLGWNDISPAGESPNFFSHLCISSASLSSLIII